MNLETVVKTLKLKTFVFIVVVIPVDPYVHERKIGE